MHRFASVWMWLEKKSQEINSHRVKYCVYGLETSPQYRICIGEPTKNPYFTLRSFWAHLCVCTVGSYASLTVCLLLDQKSLDQKSYLSHRSKVMGQGQSSCGSRLKVKYIKVKPSLKVMSLADGLMSTSSCIFFSSWILWKVKTYPHFYEKQRYNLAWPYHEISRKCSITKTGWAWHVTIFSQRLRNIILRQTVGPRDNYLVEGWKWPKVSFSTSGLWSSDYFCKVFWKSL